MKNIKPLPQLLPLKAKADLLVACNDLTEFNPPDIETWPNELQSRLKNIRETSYALAVRFTQVTGEIEGFNRRLEMMRHEANEKGSAIHEASK